MNVPPRTYYPRLNKSEREKVAALARRHDFLAELGDEANSYDLHEKSALAWALNFIRTNQEQP